MSGLLLGPTECDVKDRDDGGDLEEVEEPIVGPGFAQEVFDIDKEIGRGGGEVEDPGEAGGQ